MLSTLGGRPRRGNLGPSMCAGMIEPKGPRRCSWVVCQLSAMTSGATHAGEFDEPEGHWITLLDPEGNEFCLH